LLTDEQQPKAWTELQAGIECLTQLFLLIDAMSSAPASTQPSFDVTEDQRAQEEEAEDLKEAASTLLSQLIYNGEVLDISLDALKSYKPGTQSLMYLDGSVGLAYSLLRFAYPDSLVECLLINGLRMLEKWSKRNSSGEGGYVRKKVGKKKKKKVKGRTEGELLPFSRLRIRVWRMCRNMGTVESSPRHLDSFSSPSRLGRSFDRTVANCRLSNRRLGRVSGFSQKTDASRHVVIRGCLFRFSPSFFRFPIHSYSSTPTSSTPFLTGSCFAFINPVPFLEATALLDSIVRQSTVRGLSSIVRMHHCFLDPPQSL
jgi:hypothetical protein